MASCRCARQPSCARQRSGAYYSRPDGAGNTVGCATADAHTRNGAPDGGDRQLWGASAVVPYQLSEQWALAARGEHLHDDASYGGGDVWRLFTLTGTLEYLPLGAPDNLILRWENRWERSNQHVFGKDSRGTRDVADDLYTNAWFETVLGVVVLSSTP